MAHIYCKNHFDACDQKINKLMESCPGEWAKVITGWSKVDMFCDSCDSLIGIGDPAKYLIFLAPSLRDPLTEKLLFQVNGQIEKTIQLS